MGDSYLEMAPDPSEGGGGSYLEMGPDGGAGDGGGGYLEEGPDGGAGGGGGGSYLEMGPDGGGGDGGPSYLEMGPDGGGDDGIEACYLEMKPDVEIGEDELQGYLKLQANKAAQEGGDTGYLAVDPDWLADQWDMLSTQPWFRGFFDRSKANAELKGKDPGTFVTRVSTSQPGHFALSVVQDGGHIDHMLILPSYAGDPSVPGNTRYRLGTYSRSLFNTIPKLVAYYIGHPYIDQYFLLGEVVPEKQEGGYMAIDPDDV